MNRDKIKIAKQEAERFLQRVKEFNSAIDAGGYEYGSMQGGALRRSSMDLTRALAAMRRPL
jgi:hypothetical protein